VVSGDSGVFTLSLNDHQPQTLKEKRKTLSDWRSELFKLVSPRLEKFPRNCCPPNLGFTLTPFSPKFPLYNPKKLPLDKGDKNRTKWKKVV